MKKQETHLPTIEKIIAKIKPLKREVKLLERTVKKGRLTTVIIYALGDYLRISAYSNDDLLKFAKAVKKSFKGVSNVSIGSDVIVQMTTPLNQGASVDLEQKIKKTLQSLELPTKNDPKWIDYAAKHIAKGIKK